MQETASSYPVDENFDPLSEDYLQDPYAYYAWFRREAPIFFAPKISMWVVSRYEDILAIVKDPETFSNARVQEPLQELEPEQRLKEGVRVTPTTSNANPPKHRRTRKHASKTFSAKRVQALEPRVREISEGLIDGFIDEGRVDFIERFAFPLPGWPTFASHPRIRPSSSIPISRFGVQRNCGWSGRPTRQRSRHGHKTFGV